MHTILEYVGITIVFIFILLIMGYYISVPLTNLSAIKSEQLTSVSQRMLDTIVLTTGDPEDWERRTDNPISFGLKLENTSATLYILNPDKITRLANGSIYGREFFNPLYINKETVSQIIGAYKSYGFRIELQPIPNITIICNKENFPDIVDVYVNDRRNMTLPGINVTLYYIIVKRDGSQINETVLIKDCVSSIDGKCSFSLGSYLSSINENNVIGYVILAKAVHHGSISVALSKVGKYNLATLVGRSLYVDESLTSSNIMFIDSIKTVFNDNSSWINYNRGKCTEFVPQVYSTVSPIFPLNVSTGTSYTVNGRTFSNYTLEFVDYSAYIITMVGFDGTEYRLIISVRPPLIKYGYMVPKGNVEVSESFVNIAGYSYILRLYIWRTEI